MALLADYRGHLVNHVEVLYRSGERELAIAFFEALGCEVVDTETPCETGSTILYCWPEPGQRDRLNNVIYLSEIRPAQRDVEDRLAEAMAADAGLADAIGAYRHKARTAPHGIPHFGLRYPSFAGLEAVVGRLEGDLPDALADRVTVDPIRPGDPRSMTDELIQAFVTTDVVACGLFALGQLVELQAQELRSP